MSTPLAGKPPAGTGWIDEHGRLFLDISTLTAMAHCSTEAMVRYGWGYQAVGEESAPLKSGTEGHEAMATYFRTGGDAKAALATFQAGYEDWAAEHVADPNDRLSYDNVSRVLDQWFADHPLAHLPFYTRPDLVEIAFAHPIADDVVIVGRIDLIGQNEDDSQWSVIDHKFTGRIDEPWIRSFRASQQLTGYAKIAQEISGREITGAYVNAVELSRLPDLSGITKCREHGVPYTECAPRHGPCKVHRICETHNRPADECPAYVPRSGMTKCKKVGVLMTECADRHIRTCNTHDTPYNECANQHLHSRLFRTTRDDRDYAMWTKDAVKIAREFRSLLEKYPTIDDVSKLRTKGKWTGRCTWCSLSDFCLAGRRDPALIETMLVHKPWRPWGYAEAHAKDLTPTTDV